MLYLIAELRNSSKGINRKVRQSCKEWEDYRSTYLYDFLNGFSLTNENRILWIDEEIGKEKYVNGPFVRINAKARDWKFDAAEDISSLVK